LRRPALSFLLAVLVASSCAELRAVGQLPRASFSISASLLNDTIRDPSETTLEIGMTNISQKNLGYFVSGWPLWEMFDIEVRDSAGNPVAMTPEGRRIAAGPRAVTMNVLMPLKPGQTLRVQVLLNSVFELQRPGKYTVKVERKDDVTGLAVRSRPVALTVPEGRPLHERLHKTFSIRISPLHSRFEPGWLVPVNILIKNLSRHDLKLAVWDGANPETPGEFGSGLRVTKSHGEPVPSTRKGRDIQGRAAVPAGGFEVEVVHPGETFQEIRCVGDLTDVENPGRYRIRVELTDPTNNRLVVSNSAAVTVIGKGEEKLHPIPLHPPYIITISRDQSPPFKEKVPLRICQTNISNRIVTLDNGTPDYAFRILDAQGTEVPFTKAGRKVHEYSELHHEPSVGSKFWSPTVWKIKPGGTLCGIQDIGVGRDLSTPGTYSVQIVRDDYPDETPSESADHLPSVKSNIVRLSVPP
jgi:hypothetical protein